MAATTSGASFGAAIDQQGLRLMTVSLPNTWSLGGILEGLGVSAASSLGDIMTMSSTELVYVPSVAGATGTPPP